jgi:hypothetical protein
MCLTDAFVSEWQQLEGGKLYFADDPVVRANPGMFDTQLERHAVGFAQREAARFETLDEPVKRGPGRPRKDSYV